MADKTGAVFTGQGSQRPGMGQDFYQNNDTAKKVFDEASDAIGEDIAKLCFEEDPKLNLTEFTQPAIVTTEIAIFRALADKYSFAPVLFAGHSLGEYAALCAAGVIPLKEVVQIVRKRGQLMQEAVPAGVGKMAALVLENIESSDYATICRESGAEIANYNSIGQVVISGATDAIDTAMATLAEKIPEMKVVPLEVSAPFHSSMMKTIEPGFREFLEGFLGSFTMENVGQVLSNYTGTYHTPDTLISDLTSQISGSVRWTDNMDLMKGTGVSIFEIGPNKVLSKFFATIDVTVPAIINERSAAKAFEVN